MDSVSLRNELMELRARNAANAPSEGLLRKSRWTDAEVVQCGAASTLLAEEIGALVLKGVQERVLCSADNPANVPDARRIFSLLETHGNLATEGGYTEETFGELLREMLVSEHYRLSIHSNGFFAFVRRTKAGVELLGAATPEQQSKYHAAKQAWLEHLESLGELLAFIERQRKANARVDQQFLDKFRDVYFPLREAANRVRLLQRKIEAKEANLDLTMEALEQQVSEDEDLKAAQQELDRLRTLAPSMNLEPTNGDGDFLSPDEVNEILQAYKSTLIELWMMLHPDRLQHHPSYAGLTETQKDQLAALWLRLSSIRPQELASSPNHLEYTLRQRAFLVRIRREAEAILSLAGIDVDANLIVQGNTLEEQIEWFEQQAEFLQWDLDHARADLKVLMEASEVQERAAILAMSAGQQEDLKKEMTEKAQQHEQQAERLQSQLDKMFNDPGTRFDGKPEEDGERNDPDLS